MLCAYYQMLNLNYKNMETKNCDCLETTKELINKNISERKNNPKGFKIIESNWESCSWYPKIRLFNNFVIKSTFEKKDGTISKILKNRIAIFFTYCPFCGRKYDE
jgi:hypothetical protein